MIDFRYHIVSIASVFLALALGLVLGATVLNGAAVSDLEEQVSQLRDDKQGLRTEVTDLRHELERGEEFLAALAPRLVGGQLSGRRVVLVTLPGVSDEVREGTLNVLTLAGAEVTAQVDVDADLFAAAQAAVVDTLAGRLVQPDVTLPTGAPIDRASAVIAGALLDRATPPAMSAADTAVLAAYQEARLLRVRPGARAGAVAVVVSGPATVPESEQGADATDSRPVTGGLRALLGRLETAGRGTVVVAPRVDDGPATAVSVVRTDEDLARSVSTVDDADETAGTVRLVFAVAGELRGEVGHYGSGTGATDVLASPAPR